ncbi:MAG: preprotein translocase subunit SecG [Deltaproteobacteria bacterium]|nr:preprotein translocase subunit SecG [Deltaproteobacteria bacterium]
MSILITIIHIIVCLALILIVLLQTGKGANMGSLFGGGSSASLFGSGGASTFLTKATTIAAIIFMVTSLILTSTSGKKKEVSVIEKVKVMQTKDTKTETSAQAKQSDATNAETNNTK